LKSDNSVSYYHSDHLGSSNVISDANGSKLASYEYQPYGKISQQTGQNTTNYKFTGKELDTTGLYYYGARYYDPEIGRFITADPTIQHPNDPQDFNRYAYCRNNPINYVDPTGYGWFKKFIKGYGSLFGFGGAAIKGAVTGDWSSLQNMATTTATAFIFSGGNPVTTLAAFSASSVTETAPGKKVIENAGREVFDDGFGMRPRAAHMWSSVAVNIGLTLGFEAVFANVFAGSAAGIRDFDAGNVNDAELMRNPEGYYPFDGRYPGGPGKSGFDLTQSDISLKTFINNSGKASAIVGKGNVQGAFRSLSGIPQHTGGIVKNFHGAGMKTIWPGWARGVYGTCHQVTNASLLTGGLSNTVAGVFPHWSTWATTAIYGNYGGQIGTHIYTGLKARDNY
jgi:RHS repeat-associated protein